MNIRYSNKIQRILYCLLIFYFPIRTNAQGLICFENYFSASCDQPLVLISDNLYQNYCQSGNPLIVDVEIKSNSSTLLQYTSIPLTDPSVFSYLGAVTFTFYDYAAINQGWATKIVHVYKLNQLNYPMASGYELQVKITYSGNNSYLINEYYNFGNSRFKSCGSCNNCYSKYELFGSVRKFLEYDVFIKLFGMDGGINKGYDFTLLNPQTQQANINNYVVLMNWLLGMNTPTENDWRDVLNPDNYGNTTIPEVFCQSDNANECPCIKDVIGYYSGILTMALGPVGVSSLGDVNSIRNDLERHLRISCDCSGSYCYDIAENNNEIKIRLLPRGKANLPALYLCVNVEPGTGSKYSYFGYSFDFSNPNSPPPNIPSATDIPLNSVEYNGSGTYTHINGFDEIYLYAQQLGVCEIPCEQCIPSFSPIPGKKYIFATWVKESNANGYSKNYIEPTAEIIFSNGSPPQFLSSSGIFTTTGPIIEGWQKIDGQFTVPLNAERMRIELQSNGGDSYFDDVRVTPLESNAKTYVFDPVTLKLSAILDEQNYATLYEYDNEGNLSRVKKETERGIMTLKEVKSSTIKK